MVAGAGGADGEAAGIAPDRTDTGHENRIVIAGCCAFCVTDETGTTENRALIGNDQLVSATARTDVEITSIAPNRAGTSHKNDIITAGSQRADGTGVVGNLGTIADRQGIAGSGITDDHIIGKVVGATSRDKMRVTTSITDNERDSIGLHGTAAG